MILTDFRIYSYIVFALTALIFILMFASFLTNKTPAVVILLSVINIFFSSYMSLSAYNVVQMTATDGVIEYTKLTTIAFDPLFYSSVFQIIYWFSIITFLLGIAFSLVVIYDNKKQPRWHTTSKRINERLNRT